jgi:hypothetical protein
MAFMVVRCNRNSNRYRNNLANNHLLPHSVKDKETTQDSCGFRISGFKVWQPTKGEWLQPERQWGRDRTADNVGETFTLFGSGGARGCGVGVVSGWQLRFAFGAGV